MPRKYVIPIVSVLLIIFVFQECIFDRDETIKGTGTITYLSFEGGFYGIVGDDGNNYDPINLAQEFQEDGLRVRFTAKLSDDAVSYHMWGTIIEIIRIENCKGMSSREYPRALRTIYLPIVKSQKRIYVRITQQVFFLKRRLKENGKTNLSKMYEGHDVPDASKDVSCSVCHLEPHKVYNFSNSDEYLKKEAPRVLEERRAFKFSRCLCLQVPDLDKAAEFYQKAWDLK